VIRKKIIIPRGFSKPDRNISSFRFFSSRLIVIQIGRPIEFKNEDDNPHFIESVNMEEEADSFLYTAQIKPGETKTVILRNLKKLIPYRCRIHPEERGVILMTEKEDSDLTITERLRLATQTRGRDQEFWNIIK
jgi:hypothetical protein